MTNEEYQQLFPWNEYTFAVRDGRSFVSFSEKPIPQSFKIGDTEFRARDPEAQYPVVHYVSNSDDRGISLFLMYPKPERERTFLQEAYASKTGTLSDHGRWAARRGNEWFSEKDSPMQALKALQDWLHKSALRGPQDQRDHDIVSAMLT